MWVGNQQAQLVPLDDDLIAVAPRARAHPATASVVWEKGHEKGPSLAIPRARQPTFSTMSFFSVQPNETKWPAAVDGEPPPLAVPPPLLFEVLAAVYTLLS